MTQLPLDGDWTRPHALRVVDDYGYVGDGASGAHGALCENGEEYLLKGPAYSPGHPQVAANEIIAAGLAGLLTLPILDHTIAESDGHLFFASSLMPKKTFMPFVTPELLETCQNRDRVYDVAVFDTWICNSDRHSGNLLLREVQGRRGNATYRMMLMNDHSHSLVQPGAQADGLPTILDAPARSFIQLEMIKESIRDRDRLEADIAAAEGVSDYDLEHLVRGVPTPLLPDDDRRHYIGHLVTRRDRLRSLLTSDAELFPHLGGIQS